MNSHLPVLFWGVILATFGLATWFASDMRSILKSGQRKNQLSIEGNWRALENYFESAEQTRRLFVWLYQKYLLPGGLTTQHALFLFKQGRLDEALVKVDQAIRQIERKPWIFRSCYSAATFKMLCGSFRTRTLILTGLGRYDEARATAAELEKLTGPRDKPNTALALLEFYCGHIEEALTLARAMPAGDAQTGSMRGIMALCYTVRGDFEQAVQALSYAPSDITQFYSPSGLSAITGSTEGSELLELQRRKIAGIFPPVRLISLAQVYIAMEHFDKADQALDQAERSMGPEPGIQVPYCRYRACSFAGQGKSKEAENFIERMREIVRGLPKRSLLFELHTGAGRSYLYLKRFNEALSELTEAERVVLHPVERHTTNYWIAKTHEAVGNKSEAIRYYEIVAADAIPSWMRMQAAEALASLKN